MITSGGELKHYFSLTHEAQLVPGYLLEERGVRLHARYLRLQFPNFLAQARRFVVQLGSLLAQTLEPGQPGRRPDQCRHRDQRQTQQQHGEGSFDGLVF